MKSLLKGLMVITAALLLFYGCAEVAKAPVETGVSATETFQQKALAYEKKGQWELALMNWELAAKLQPESSKAAEQLSKLRAYLNKRAEEQFKKGVALFEKEDLKNARAAFVAALRYNPDHQRALEYLKKKPDEVNYTLYKVEKEETLKKIARKVYNDPEKDFLVAYFSGLDISAAPPIGTTLVLPNLSSKLTESVMDVEAELNLAKIHLKHKRFHLVFPLTEKVLDYDPTNEAATEITNAAYYEMGKEYERDKRFLRSKEMFSKVDADYKDTKKVLTKLDAEINEQAEIHYRRGIKHFLNEKLEGAILEWSKTLALRPDHKKAQKDIENARRLLEKLEKVK